ncbi:MAG: ATP-dependent DNA ligase [Chloroflexi bacterium]|nr:ATP-dependent DNA ligase [Chloroflexota bacterium]
MEFSELARVFQAIEATRRRLEITALLADLFRRAPEDADILPYLLQGRLGPPYATPDLGMDERRIAQALAEATGTEVEEVWRRYGELGDLGLVAEALLPTTGEPVTVRAVFADLRAIAAASGKGAQERKIALFRDLLRRLGARAARYVVRIAQGRLRLQVGDATIVDALAAACDGAPRAPIERAYALSADLGLVARTLLADGPAALARIHPTPGRPVLSALAERLPTPQAVIQKLGRVLAEPKYDGLRLQAHKRAEQVWLFSRRLEDLTHAFPDIARAVRQQVRADEAILDGEAVGYDPRRQRFLPFQQTVRRRRKHGVEAMELLFPLRYYAFDLLYLDGADYTSLPQEERSRRLRDILREQPEGILHVAPQLVTADAAELGRFFDETVGRGLEGLVVKRPDAPYHAGAREFNWVKLKRGYQRALADTFDLVIVGYDRGRGKRARLGIGSLLCAVYDPEQDRFRTVSRVGSGLSDDEWVELRDRLDAVRVDARPGRVESLITPDVWVEPTYVVEVIAAEITRSPLHTCGKVDAQPGFALRFPRVASIRFDRRPEDATTEAEIVRLYSLRA